ncbi:SDR family oxidoreductase [Spongiibacter taiwanensis]|uniref:SDR family oxidoreductase n=1 Tax=Spongiibacter taiwanensis TaxID=1748242 RepID=UPI0020352A60|nr:SDR family oxidoreductase [Spongiibacter taiwanensis]USA42731.1 SDR family oxidoreductase [Spongiibacter taiwanensis]
MTNSAIPRVLISGASQGIGAAIAEAFANADTPVHLALVARNEAGLRAAAERCSGAASVEIFPADASDPEQVAALKAKLSPVDVLVNNAGRWLGKPVTEMSVTEFDDILGANLRSTFLLSNLVLPGMLAAGRGDIFNMVSTAAYEGYAGVSAYCAAKHGVLGFSRALREEVKGKNIRVCTVSPGPTYSPSWEGTGIDAKRLMPPKDIARVFLQMYQMDRNVVVEEMILRPQVGHIASE